MNSIIIFFIVFYLYFLLYNFIGYNSFTTINIESKFIINGKYDKKKLINVLNSYDIFNYKLINNFLIKTNKKSYKIINNKNQNKLDQDTILIIYETPQPKYSPSLQNSNEFTHHSLELLTTHKLFDMQFLMNIINDYINNNVDFKEMVIYKNICPLLSKPFYFNLIINLLVDNLSYKQRTSRKIIFNKSNIEEIKNELVNKLNGKFISDLDVIISLLSKDYMDYKNKIDCNLCICKSIRNSKNKYNIGNLLVPSNINIKNNELENIAISIRNSYNENCFIKNIDLMISSWVPHKLISTNIVTITSHDYLQKNLGTDNIWGNNNFIFVYFNNLTNEYTCLISYQL
jgi:hypothetical protein